MVAEWLQELSLTVYISWHEIETWKTESSQGVMDERCVHDPRVG